MDRSSKEKRQQLLNFLEDKIPDSLLSSIPKHWWIVGEILIFSVPISLQQYQKEIGEAFLQLESKRVKTILGKTGPTTNIIRTPKFQFLAGDEETVTIHKELGCKFKIDAAKLTFSPGNLGERTRLISITNEDEFIVDMFSCVGNLSLPLAVHKKPRKLIAAEINPYAFNFLKENIELNNVKERMIALLGDNRAVLTPYHNMADRVLSGYLQADKEQIKQAIRLCKKGGILHFHDAVPMKKKFKDKSFSKVFEIASLENRSTELLLKRRVKKYSPGVEHLVLDIKIN